MPMNTPSLWILNRRLSDFIPSLNKNLQPGPRRRGILPRPITIRHDDFSNKLLYQINWIRIVSRPAYEFF